MEELSAMGQVGITTMKGNQMGYHLREGFRSIFSHGLMSFAAVSMIVGCLLIMGSFSLVAVNVDHMLAELEADNAFLAFIDEELSVEEAKAIEQQLGQVENISNVTFVTREEAMDNFLKDKQESLFQDVPTEVFRHRYRINVEDLELMGGTVEEVEAVTGVVKVRAELEIAEGFIIVRNIIIIIFVVFITFIDHIIVYILTITITIQYFCWIC